MSRSTSLLVLAALASTALTTPVAATAAGVDPSLFQDLHWRSIGPFRGGRVLAVEGAPDDAKRFYFGGYLLDNYVQTADAVGLTRADLTTLARNSFSGSFLPEADKAAWIARIDALA